MTAAHALPCRPAWRAWLMSEYSVLMLSAVAFVYFALRAPHFATQDNVRSIALGCLPLLVLAVGQTVVMITGGIDLSVGSIVGCSSVVGSLVMSGDAGWLANRPEAAFVAVAAMLLCGAAIGAVNGASVAWLRMPPFMVTLATMMFFGGFAVWLPRKLANTESLYQFPAGFLKLGENPWLAGGMAVLCALAAHVLLRHTLLGRWLHAVGHNARAARISGVPTEATILSAYVFNGLLAGVAAILLTASLQTGSPNHGKQMLLDVIGAVAIGGTRLFGGKGKVTWTIFGVMFLAILGNGLTALNLSDFLITMIKGAVILGAALFDVWRNRRA